jgi:hypothetical protein
MDQTRRLILCSPIALLILLVFGPLFHIGSADDQLCAGDSITAAQYDQLGQLLLKDKGKGTLSQGWGCVDCRNLTSCPDVPDQLCKHPGVDYGVPRGTAVFTPVSGLVTTANPGKDCQRDDCLSTLAIFDEQANKTYVFLHMDSFLFSRGQHVDAGRQVGTSGWRGHASGPHLHYEVRAGKQVAAALCFTGRSGTINPYTNTPLGTGSPPPTGTSVISWEFNSDGNFEGWRAINISGAVVQSGILFIDPAGADPNIVGPDISVSASTYQYVDLNMASNAPDGNGNIYFKTQAENAFNENKKVSFSVFNCAPPSANPTVSCYGHAPFHRYFVNMASHQKWNGIITGIRVDPADNGVAGTNKDTIGFDYVRLEPAITTAGVVDPPPPLFATATVSPSTPTINADLLITTTIENPSNLVNDLTVNTEVFDANGQRVTQSSAEHQDFGAGEIKNFGLHWVPTQLGQYSINLSVLTGDGTVNCVTVNDARTFSVAGPGPSPSPTPPDHQISGRVTDANGIGVSGADIIYAVRRPGDDVSPSRPEDAFTDINGYFSIKNLVDGLNYFVSPDIPGYYTAPRNVRFDNLNGDRTANFTVMKSPSLAPTIFTEATTDRALTFDSATFVVGPFATRTAMNFSTDQRTRIMIFVSNLNLPPTETFTASDIEIIEDAPAIQLWPAVENYGAVADQPGLSFVVVTLPDDPNLSGDVWLKINFLGTLSNRVRITIKPQSPAGSPRIK